jgi:hypothetical protein
MLRVMCVNSYLFNVFWMVKDRLVVDFSVGMIKITQSKKIFETMGARDVEGPMVLRAHFFWPMCTAEHCSEAVPITVQTPGASVWHGLTKSGGYWHQPPGVSGSRTTVYLYILRRINCTYYVLHLVHIA